MNPLFQSMLQSKNAREMIDQMLLKLRCDLAVRMREAVVKAAEEVFPGDSIGVIITKEPFGLYFHLEKNLQVIASATVEHVIHDEFVCNIKADALPNLEKFL